MEIELQSLPFEPWPLSTLHIVFQSGYIVLDKAFSTHTMHTPCMIHRRYCARGKKNCFDNAAPVEFAVSMLELYGPTEPLSLFY